MILNREEYKGHTIAVHQEDDMENPIKFDRCLTKFIFFGKYKYLGHDHEVDIGENFINRHDFMEKGGEMVRKETDAFICKPVHIYEHGGISLSFNFSGQYADRFDSGTVGFAVVTKKDLQKFFNRKNMTRQITTDTEATMKVELEGIDDFVNGRSYGYSIDGPAFTDEDVDFHYEDTDDCIHDAQYEINERMPDDGILPAPYEYYIFYEGQEQVLPAYRKKCGFEELSEEGWVEARKHSPFKKHTVYRKV